MLAWLAGEFAVGVIFVSICRVRHRMSYCWVVALFLIGDLFRTLGGHWGGVSPGGLGLAYSGSLPQWLGIASLLAYGSFALVPFAVLLFSDKQSAKAAGVLVLADGIIHFLLPVQPPWMTGHAQRWVAQQSFIHLVKQDPNPLAAFPSLHVALPASQRWYPLAIAISVAVVLLGEHWVIDVVAGWGMAFASRAAVARWWPESRPAPRLAEAPSEVEVAAGRVAA
jgi:membrane-associated phospholipid phosphatase